MIVTMMRKFGTQYTIIVWLYNTDIGPNSMKSSWEVFEFFFFKTDEAALPQFSKISFWELF